MWNHCSQKISGGQAVTMCNYCVNVQWKLSGSTSSALYHIKSHHLEKLTEAELFQINEKSQGTEQTSPQSSLPARSPRASGDIS